MLSVVTVCHFCVIECSCAQCMRVCVCVCVYPTRLHAPSFVVESQFCDCAQLLGVVNVNVRVVCFLSYNVFGSACFWV